MVGMLSMIRGLIGEKLGHSFSKEIHEKLVDKPYTLYSLNQDEVIQLLKDKAIDAINVTIPYKELVIDYLDELDESVSNVGACNCIIQKKGKLIGYNTDYDGFNYTLRKNGLFLRNKKILIIGKGGASKAIEACLRNEQVASIQFLTRSKRNDTLSYDDLDKAKDVSWIINTSPMGMFPHNEQQDIDLDQFTQLEGIIDIVYNPLNTRLMIEGMKRNLKVVGGLEMLVAQGVYAVEWFEGIKLKESTIDTLYQALYQKKLNLVLIGMPFSGKTTLGKLLKDKFNRVLYDIDELIETKINMKISDYFETHSEEDFRVIESSVIKEVSRKNGCIIVCGGGVVKNINNYLDLKQNGQLIHIYRPIDKMVLDDNRPLSKSIEQLQALWLSRKAQYEYFEDIRVENNECIEVCLERILEQYGYHI